MGNCKYTNGIPLYLKEDTSCKELTLDMVSGLHPDELSFPDVDTNDMVNFESVMVLFSIITRKILPYLLENFSATVSPTSDKLDSPIPDDLFKE